VVSNSLFRPTDISNGKGNAGKAARLLGWKAQVHMQEVIARMVSAELGVAPAPIPHANIHP
jgi:GDPmannose 4,6-dehydratase